MTKGDIYTKEITKKILDEGCLDVNPRPHWLDGTPAHNYSINGVMTQYDLDKGETPVSTLRPMAIKAAIGEILWIYRDMDNNVFNLEMKYKVRWWRSWVINPYHYDEFGRLIKGANPHLKEGFYYDKAGHKLDIIPKGTKGVKSDTVDPISDYDGENILDSESGNVLTKDATIGSTYGAIIRRYDLMNRTRQGLIDLPDSRYHIINMWQEIDFSELYGLKPCAFMTQWHVRHGRDGVDYLDMELHQRSSDFVVAGTINQVQYVVLLYMVAHDLGLKVGRFTWFVGNIQIYDRHIDKAREIMSRSSVDCEPYFAINEAANWDNMMPDDVILQHYPDKLIKKKNPQISLEVAI